MNILTKEEQIQKGGPIIYDRLLQLSVEAGRPLTTRVIKERLGFENISFQATRIPAG